jgi:hypothetical protein
MTNQQYKPITQGRDFNFFKKMDVSNTVFSEDCDVVVSFPSDSISFYNEGSGVVELSFNGNTVHAELNPSTGSANVTVGSSQGISKIWFRLGSGSASTVRIQSNASIESSKTQIYDGTNILGTSTHPMVVGYGDTAAVDAFERLRVTTPFTIYETKQIVDSRPIVWDVLTSLGGTAVHNSNRASSLLSVTSTNGSQVLRQTKPRMYYQAAKSMAILSTFIMGSTPVGIVKRNGYFDGYNGLFFQANGPTNSFVMRSNVSGVPVDTVINQSNWNLDKMDGTGTSGITLDITKIQILIIDFQWLGAGRIRFGFVIDGLVRYAHQISNANGITSVYMSTPNLPLRHEITNVSSSSGSTLEPICNAVLSEGGFENKGYLFSVNRGASSLSTVDSAHLYPLISLRLDVTKLGVIVTPTNFNVLCTSTNANFEWALVLNPTINGTDAVSWQSVTNSGAQYDISRTLTNFLTGGTTLLSGYGAQGSAAINVDVNTIYTLGINLSNISDQIVLGIRKVGGGTDDFIGALSWKEFV